MKTYFFEAELEHDEDGRWSASIPRLPGCAAWGYTEEDALENLKEAAHAYLEVLVEDGRPLPKEAEQAAQEIRPPVVAIPLRGMAADLFTFSEMSRSERSSGPWSRTDLS